MLYLLKEDLYVMIVNINLHSQLQFKENIKIYQIKYNRKF